MPRIYGNLQREQRDWRPFWRFLRRLAALGGFALILYFFFFSKVFTVRTVQVQGAVISDAQAIAALVPTGESIWRVPDAQIRQNIMRTQPVVGVTIFKGLPNTIRVVVQEGGPTVSWQTGNDLYLLDKNGIPFFHYALNQLPAAGSPADALLARLPKVLDTKNLPVVLDSPVVSTGFVSFITNFQTQLAKYLPDQKLQQFEVADTTYDVTARFGSGVSVLLSSTGDAGAQVRNFDRLLNQTTLPQNAQVDLRIDRWAYVSHP